MARAGSGKGRGKKAAAKKKRKVAVSRKTQPPPRGTSDNTPSRIANMPVRDTSNLDVANEIARRHRDQLAATAAQQPQQQSASALLAGEGFLSADATIINDTVEAHKAMLARIAELEARIAELEATVAALRSPSTPGIGHNNPPPLDDAELEEIKREIALLKAQPAVPTAAQTASQIASKFIHGCERVTAWVAQLLNTFATEFAKSAGHEAGKAVVQLLKWYALGSGLMLSAAAILQWLNAAAK